MELKNEIEFTHISVEKIKQVIGRLEDLSCRKAPNVCNCCNDLLLELRDIKIELGIE